MSLQDISNNYESDVEEQEEQEDINDFENIGMIPCEICQNMINFDDYSNHLTDCITSYNLRRERFNILNDFLNILNASDNVMRGPNINNNFIPRDDETMNDTDDIQEYNDENEINEENTGNVNNEDVSNIEVNSEEDDVDRADNAVNESNDELVEPYDQFIRNFTPLHRVPNTDWSTNIPLILPNVNNIYWSNNIGRRLINDLEINIGNLHNLTNENNNTDYDFNLLIQGLMGGDVKIGVKDFNKTINILKQDELNEDDICNICLDNLKYKNNECEKEVKLNLPVKTICNHLYCRECIYKWLSKNKTCPVCKHEFEHEDNENNEDNEDNENNLDDYSSLPDLV